MLTKVFLTFLLLQTAMASELVDFKSDGCSMSPDANYLTDTSWLDCCIMHDVSYWMGGTDLERKETDERFGQCIDDKTDLPLATIAKYGVRVGGQPVFSTPFKWGFGWKKRNGYLALTTEEKKLVFKKLTDQKILTIEQVQEIIEFRNLQ